MSLSAAAFAQNALPVLPAGDAAVAGFSGTVVAGSPPEARRLDKTFIDLNGPALRVIGLDRLGARAQGQLVAAKKPFTATARQIGQVFSVALDDANPPNIYAAATSAYGLPIVVPDNDGDGLPDRSRGGAPNAAFMPGLFGPPIAAGGPGSIWKINGSTGAVTLFANVTLAGVPNSGPALGGLAFDAESHQLFVADRDTGMIHRFTLDGAERGVFDHGTQALAAAGLPPVPFDPRKRINLQNPAFDSTNPETWGYAPPARRVFGLAVNQGRLYYAVAAGPRIWSVALLRDGSFGSDARGEITVPRGAQAGSEISEILFDNSGDMLVAERGAPTGAYDYEALAEPGESRVLRFRPTAPDDPPSEDFWFPVPREYAIGFSPNFHNDNGGIAIGYGYDAAGTINRAVCSGSLWTSGERLRMSPDPAISRLLQPGGPLAVHGLQGNPVAMVQPLNLPPFNSYFIDYYSIGERPAWAGHLGGVAIWRVCPHTKIDPVLGEILTEAANQTSQDCPAGYTTVNDQCVPTSSSCPPEQMTPDGKCGQPVCKPERRQHAIGIPCCPEGQVANNGRCTKPNGPDLSIDKTIISCTDKGVCKFRITVTNNGPGNYTGPIIVLEDLSPGNITSNQLISPAGGNFNCGPIPTSSLPQNVQQLVPPGDHLHACVVSNATLRPGEKVVMEVGGKVAQTLHPGKPQNCAAVIGNSLNESNYANNVKCIPIPPPPQKYHVDKTAPKSCTLFPAGSQVANAYGSGGPTYSCKFTVTVTNDGTVPVSGAVFIDTPTPPARVGDIEPGENSPPQSWSCPPNPTSTTCTRSPGYDIPPGPNGHASLDVYVVMPVSSATSDMVENCAVAPGATAPNAGPIQTGNSLPGSATQALSNQLQQGLTSGPSSQSPQGPPGPLSGLDPLQQGVSSKPGTGIDSAARLRQALDNQLRKCAHVQIQVGTPQPSTPPKPPPPPPPPCADGSARNSDGNCPTPTTTSCPFPTFNVNGTCCTREALTAGTCGPTVTSTCPPAQVSVNGTCCNIRDYQAGRCGGTPTVPCRGKDCPTPGTGLQPTCPFPKLLIGGQCVCRGGTVGDDCHVPTTPTCPNAQISVNGTCCDIRAYQTGHCGGTSDLCPNGKQKKDGKCPTTPDCTGGKFFDGSACRCKFGMTEGKNGQCVRSEGDSKKTKDKTCGRGTYLVNGECVRRSPNVNQKNNKGDQKIKAGQGLNNSRLLGGSGQGGTPKSSGGSGSKGKGN